ncbi:cupin domain-containing protein [Clostridium boliviensis]|uniref:Cupin domain-containing protein n=1 Tax=Clostridium boliviensis TaxID=318465 RepID=A0ABU4GJ04_9CLOT|nr:cupin domain-containing protein [Clostridium boliviensis]MDW2797590.1 cupin domain-containing protein [Clostridium boliviensis]
MTNNTDFSSPSLQYAFDVNNSHLYVKDNQNFINILGKEQLNSLENTSLLDIYLSVSNIVEPHYHPNAAELVYCISGAAIVSILNQFTNELKNFPITPGQVVNIPRAWWHYEAATMNHTHLLAIFDAPNPQVILGSNILKFTPDEIMSETYCINEDQWKTITENIKPNTYIGPYEDCREAGYINYQDDTSNYQSLYKQQQPRKGRYPYV